MAALYLRLPFPPSVNRLWRYGKGNWYLTKVARDYKTIVQSIINGSKAPKFAQDQRLEMEVLAYPPDNRSRDIDNICKSLLDALQDAGAYYNDSQIKTLHLEIRERINKEGHVDVTISTI